MNLSNPMLQINDLKAGDHICCVYETEEEHRLLLTPFIRNGLEAGDKVIYITDVHTAETVINYLREDGLEVEPYTEKKQIVFFSSTDVYLREGVFDPAIMIALLRDETHRALKEGFSALRVTGEMSWALNGSPGSERLIEYEAKLNELIPENQCLALCQYDKRRFSSELLQGVLYTHPVIAVGTNIFDNFYYIAPIDHLGGNLEQAKLDNYLQTLARNKNTEEKLRKSLDEVNKNEEKLQLIFECVANGVVVTDLQGSITDLNEQAVQMHGSGPKKNLVGKNVLAFIAFRDQKKAAKRMQELMQQGSTDTDEFTLVRADGSEFPAEISAGLLKDTDGNPAGFVSIIRDSTERKRMEKALKDSEKKYRDLVDNALVGVFQTNIEGEIIYANKYIAQMLNESIEEVELKNIKKSYKNPKDRERLIGQLKKHGQAKHFECELVNAEGMEINVLLSATFDGDVISGMLMDITELKKMEETLRRHENEIRTITENVPALISYVDTEGKYRFVNKKYEEWFGIKRTEIIGKHYKQVLGKNTYSKIRRHVEEALEGRHVHFEDNLPYTNGGSRWVSADYLPDTDEQGKVRGFFAMVTDITASKQAEQALHERLKELTCLYQIHRAMQKNLSVEELCERVIRELSSAMRFPEITVPVIEVGGRRFVGEHSCKGLSPSLYAEIKAMDETCGHIEVYYPDDKHLQVPEEQQLLNTVADAMGVWFANKRVYEALSKNESDLARAQKIGHFGSWKWDVRNKTLTWSDELFRIFGVKKGDFVLSYEGIEAMVHPDDRVKNTQKVKQMLSTAASCSYKFRIIRPDSEERHIHQTAKISRDIDGKVSKIFGIMQDITEHMRAEKKITELATFPQRDPMPIVELDLAGRVTYVNPSAKLLFPELAKKAPDHPFLAGIPIQIGRLQRNRKHSYHREVQVGEVWYSQSICVLKDFQRLRIYAMDVTVQKRNERELVRRASELQQLSKRLTHAREEERARIARELHDELGQALTAIKINVSQLERELQHSGSQKVLRRARETGELAEQLLRQVRDLSLSLRPSMLDDLGIESTLRWYSSRFSDRTGIKIDLQVEGREESLPEQLRTVTYRTIQEALTNVARHSKANKVCIALKFSAVEFLAQVEDDGKGFEVDEISSTNSVRPHLGLLGIRESVEELGGRLFIHSSPNQGTRITVKMPIED
jgi:PAS domain S-box-containing protein